MVLGGGVLDWTGGEVFAVEGGRDRLGDRGHDRVIVDLLLRQKRVANMDHLPELAAAGALSVETEITLIDGDHSSRLVDVILIAQEAAGRVLLSLELLSDHRQVLV